jgi:hypothetical protein
MELQNDKSGVIIDRLEMGFPWMILDGFLDLFLVLINAMRGAGNLS